MYQMKRPRSKFNTRFFVRRMVLDHPVNYLSSHLHTNFSFHTTRLRVKPETSHDLCRNEVLRQPVNQGTDRALT